MDTRLANSFREEQLGQQVEHSKPKSMYSFIGGRRTILEEFTTLLENLCVACMYLVMLQLKSNHNLLVGWFMQQIGVLVTLSDLKSWHMKHQFSRP